MRKKEFIPKIVLEAYDLLVQCRIVDITEPISTENNLKKQGWSFKCNCSVNYPNKENIPREVSLKVFIEEIFPFKPVEVYSETIEVTSFPHQDAESGKLCLPAESNAQVSAERLVTYIKWAKEWIEDAANGTLIKPGDPYELPDFSRKLLSEPLPIRYPVFFDESPESYNIWKPYLGGCGDVECLLNEKVNAIFAYQFFDDKKSKIFEMSISPFTEKYAKRIFGKWALVQNICYERHRPPHTYNELNEICLKNKLAILDMIKNSWQISNNSYDVGFVLIGFPIPDRFNKEPSEIHWQPLIFRNISYYKKHPKAFAKKGFRTISKKEKKKNKIWNILKANGIFSSSDQLPWGKSSNINYNRLYARGSYCSTLRSLEVSIFGCGALGCLITELFARGGVNKISLFDPDNIQISNLCRHTLDGIFIGSNKAESLAYRLSTINPFLSIDGYPLAIPLSSNDPKEAKDAIYNSDLLIDCTTCDSAFHWLNNYSTKHKKRMILIFFNFFADILTMCISNKNNSCNDILEDLMSDIKKKKLSINPDNYFSEPPKDGLIIEGAGCWHPTFPALNAYVNLLVSAAMDVINVHFNNTKELGLATLIRRNTVDDINKKMHIIEVIWKKEY